MIIIEKPEFLEILKQHKKWLYSDGKKGKRAMFLNCLLYNINFETANLRKANFHYGIIKNCDFSRANFSHASFYRTNFENTYLLQTSEIQADFNNAMLSNCTFIDCGYNLKFTNTEFGHVNFLSDRVFFIEKRNLTTSKKSDWN